MMMMIMRAWMLLVGISLLAPLVVAQGQTVGGQTCDQFAPPAEIHGKKFFDSYTGNYLPIKGISYYPRPNEGQLTVTNSIDFYTEEFRHIWERDIEQFVKLNINAVRLYAVDPGLNHDAFMCATKAAGIYVIVGLAAECYNCAITSDSPPFCYPPELKTRGQFIIQQFAKYENVLAFSAGNEVSLSKTSHSTENAPCQKKFLRDMRTYIAGCDTMRNIPVGVIKADVDREDKALYYNCRSDPGDQFENADFIGINSYLHCDGTVKSMEEMVGYQKLLKDYKSYNITIPVLWTEFGCLNESFEEKDDHETQRNFLQVEALYSQQFREEFAGGFVFEYSTEKALAQDTSPYPFNSFGPQNWGVGYFKPGNCDDMATMCEYVEFPQFETLAERYGAVDTSDEVNRVFYERTWEPKDPPKCPDQFPPLDSFTWPADSIDSQWCPEAVPVFCAGVPLDCNVVTLPPSGSSITLSSRTIVIVVGLALGAVLGYA